MPSEQKKNIDLGESMKTNRAVKFIESLKSFNEETKVDPKVAQIRKQLADLKDRDDKLKRDHEMTRKAIKNKGVMQASASDKAKWKKDMEDYKKELEANKAKRAQLRAELSKAKGIKEGMDFGTKSKNESVEAMKMWQQVVDTLQMISGGKPNQQRVKELVATTDKVAKQHNLLTSLTKPIFDKHMKILANSTPDTIHKDLGAFRDELRASR